MASSSTKLSEKVCIICRVAFSSSADKDISEVSRGLERLVEYSEKYNDVELHSYLLSKPPAVKVHNSCRRNYISKRRFEQYEQKCQMADDSLVAAKSLRSTKQAFDWKIHCFFCSEPCVSDESRKDMRHVETLEIRQSALEQCRIRDDAWGLEVQSRLMTCCDLVAEEAIYHINCHRNFYRINVRASCGRPVDAMKAETFEKVCEWLEVNDCELLTLQDVLDKAHSLLPNNDVYTEKRLKQKLVARYGDHIQFNEVRGRHNVICWRNMASYIVNEKWRKDQVNDTEHIVATAAKLLRATIQEASYDMDSYPPCKSVEDLTAARNFMPKLLQLFLDHIIYPEEKKMAIGHCIIQAVRPRTSIAPIPFAVGISVDHLCASKFLLNLLNRIGMSCSYDEVHRFKQSVARCPSAEAQPISRGFTQFAADNVDHNVCSLDGCGSLHGMGIISVTNFNPGVPAGTAAEVPVPRLQRIKSLDVSKGSKIPMLPCSLSSESMAGISFRENFHAAEPCTLSPSTNLDIVWHLSWFLQDSSEFRPSWAGFNSSVVRGKPVQSSDIRLQPIIDQNPNDSSCIYSTLVFIAKESEKLGMVTPVVTFDQPLWLKAVNIVNAHGLSVVCRLGAFHLQMSFLGSLGTLMSGSGLSDLMECCYGPNTVRHIMSGKAFARAVRAHCMVEAALTVMLLKDVLSTGTFSEELSDLRDFYSCIMSNGFDVNMTFPDGLPHIENALADLKRDLAEKSRTAKLWLQYLYYVSTLKLLVRAERTADWNLHLVSIRRMINLFAATGHANYAKCGRLYIEMMTDLPVTHPDLYDQFMAGAHIAHRSTKLWGGLSVDLTIEQALMRAVKGRGGLTHGRGVTESVRATWIATVHKTAAVKTALAQFADVEYHHDMTQHPELGKARAQRDNRDLSKLLDFLELHNPFQMPDSRLCCLTSGVAATESDNINCDEAEEVGAAIMHRVDGVSFRDVHLKRKDQVRTLADVTNTAHACGKKHLSSIDPTILFNRLLIIVQRSPDVEQYFAYELSAQPSSLFKDNCMRKTAKSHLAKEILKDTVPSSLPPISVPVIDGGYLLHVVKWSDGTTYGDVAQQYVRYVGRHYGQSSVVIFDGYCSGPSTKDHEHQRRAHKYAPDIAVDPAKSAYRDQCAFFSNERNKCAFVALLVTSLQSAGYTVHQAPDDADTMVVKVALQLAAANKAVSVIANDTDILVMLVFHCHSHMSDIFMYTESGQCVTSVAAVAERLGPSTVSRLLVTHAVSGCDTTSSLFGHGKVNVFCKLSASLDIQTSVDILGSLTASHEEVMVAGCRILALLYSGNVTESLNRLRYTMYMHATATHIQLPRPERLPPTENAARYHLYRVHLQVVQWKLLSTAALNPTEWGWKVHNGKYIPILSNCDIAPADILKVACCKCSAESKRPCGTRACMCVKYGLSCITACKNCNGEACENAQETAVDGEAAEADILDCAAEDIVDEDCVEYYMPWAAEEEVVTSMM